nr:MAG TPA: hypothetical protein [Caudoviricetes sp.]
MKEIVLFLLGKKMIKSGLLWYLLIYIFVIQMGIVGYLRSDASFYILAGVNGIALAVGAWSFSDREKKDVETKVSEKILANNKVEKSLEVKEEPQTALIEEETEDQEKKEVKSDFFVREVSDLKDTNHTLDEENTPSPQTEKKPHNIEQVRVRFNRSKSKTQATQQEGGLARFIAFLCAIVGRGGVMLLMWQEFDFIAMAIASFLMGLFILVVFKAMNIWKKSIFSSLYFLLFVLLFAGSIAGIFIDEHNSTKVLIKDQLSTFFAGLNGDIIEKQENNELSGYEYQLTGALLTGENLSGTERTGELLTGIVNTGVNLTSGTTPTEIAQPTTPQTADTQTQPTRTPSTTTQQTIQTPIHQQEKNPAQEIQKPQTPTVHTQTNPDANGQVSYLSAIKHLIATYHIPLSKSTTSKFTYVAQHSPEYPYMKTALEKRMIGTATNPNDTVSCDVYMVFKGIALNWAIEKTSNLKNDYRNVAENK